MEKCSVKHCVMGILKIKSCFTELKLNVENYEFRRSNEVKIHVLGIGSCCWRRLV